MTARKKVVEDEIWEVWMGQNKKAGAKPLKVFCFFFFYFLNLCLEFVPTSSSLWYQAVHEAMPQLTHVVWFCSVQIISPLQKETVSPFFFKFLFLIEV